MTQLEDIYELLAAYRKRTQNVASVCHRDNGTGTVRRSGRNAECWDHPSEAMAVIRKALEPPPPTKEEVRVAVQAIDSACHFMACGPHWETIKRSVEAQGEPT